jgi:hypothetical protein
MWGGGRKSTLTIYNTVLHLQIQDQSAEKLAYISTFKLQSRTKKFCYCNGASSELSTAMDYFVFLWRCGPTWVRDSSFAGFLDHTQRRTTVIRTPLDK